MKKTLTLLFALQFVAICSLQAVPAYPLPIQITQPDGTLLTIQLHGDEHFSYTTTKDGYLLKQNAVGAYEYAQFVENKIVSIGVLARDIRTKQEIKAISTLNKKMPVSEETIRTLRSKSPYKTPERQNLTPNPLRGSKKGIVILVNFTDKSFVHTKTEFNNLLNQTGYSANGATGSAREYFEAATMNEFSPQFDIVGPYTLPNNMAHYGTDNENYHDVSVYEMIRDACNLANNDVDFSLYDTDDNGIIDNVFVYYAGYNQAEGGDATTVWPHRSVVVGNYYYDGKKLWDYACTSELRGNGGNTMCGIGTFCHEFSHVLGLPDLYDTENSNRYTLGYWDLMCSGSYNNDGMTPPTYSALERFFLGYYQTGDVKVLDTDSIYLLDPITTSNKFYIISPNNDVHNLNGANPNPSEYFIIENRQKVGWDGGADFRTDYVSGTGWLYLGTGLLITKVNFNSNDWQNNNVNDYPNVGVDIIEAYNSQNPSPFTSKSDTYPGTGNVTYFSPMLSNGTRYNGDLLNIEDIGGTISFCFRECSDMPTINLLPQFTDFKTVQGTPSETCIVGVNGSKLSDPIRLAFTNSQNFEMKLPESASWSRYLVIDPNPVDSVIATSIEVRYNPASPSYRNVHTASLQAKSTGTSGTPVKIIQLTGKSSRAVRVVPPVLESITDTTGTSFKANWRSVTDATGYYVSVYTVDENNKTTEKETFNEFAKLANSGWNQTFYTTTTLSVPSTPCAAAFKTVQDTLYSPYYPEKVSSIKFWVRSEDSGQHGLLYVEALDISGVWDTVAKINVDISLTAQIKNLPLNSGKDFRRFRFSCSGISSKGFAFDDFEAAYDAKMAVKRQYVEGYNNTSVVLNGLLPLTEYICKVQATDRNVAGSDINEWYENVTDFSLPLTATTFKQKNPNDRILSVSITENSSVIVMIDTEDIENNDLFVFDIQGKLVQKISNGNVLNVNGNVTISGLPSGNSYIISLGAKRKAKFAKVFIK
ncbi:MAG: M6 family metalloprotease domain-containing protein [Prevotellaceae bacterium]|jgi:M6 family metalloprotease-like protein|nr:M6 family metalloprotease domain-containing protein [Prevotellaceae bacterium]